MSSFELMKSFMCQSNQKRYSLCDIQNEVQHHLQIANFLKTKKIQMRLVVLVAAKKGIDFQTTLVQKVVGPWLGMSGKGMVWLAQLTTQGKERNEGFQSLIQSFPSKQILNFVLLHIFLNFVPYSHINSVREKRDNLDNLFKGIEGSNFLILTQDKSKMMPNLANILERNLKM